MLISVIVIALIATFAVIGLFFNVLGSILNWFLGLFRRDRQTADNDSGNERPQMRQNMHGQNRKKRKVIDSDDGEYVDFEEVKR